ncbi:MAG TPA: hypothetical protein VN578_17080 [Candidatus Binatia bacterium]|jgi:hypothetical protein|nr:hypothetical protein [Candidatus Binatia bacterium]
MKSLIESKIHRAGLMSTALLLTSLLPQPSEAYPLGKVVFRDDAPFAGAHGPTTLTAVNTESLLTVSGWADTAATVPASLYQWFWLLGIDSGTGNGALIDGTESMTLQFDNSAGASMITFFYTGGNGGSGSSNLARITISGFASDPGATGVPYYAPRISNLSYAGGTLSFDYLNDGPGSDYGQLLLANPASTAGRTLKITGAASPNGNAPSWYAGLFGVDFSEGFGGPQVIPPNVPQNSTNTFVSLDQLLTIRGYSDSNAVTLANLGRYQDECFGLAGGATVVSNNSVTLQFANGVGLARLDSVYSGGTVILSGFVTDPGFKDPSNSSGSHSYAGGALTFTVTNSGPCSFYFTNRAASAGRTIRLNKADSQFGIGGIWYARTQTLLGPDITSNVSPYYNTQDGLVALTGYSDTPGTVPANLYENVNWFGISGGANTESIDGAESLTVHFAGGAGLSGLGTRYTSGQVIISGFTSDPGFSDPSGIATGVSYSGGTLSYTFNSPRSPEIVVAFTNLSASIGQVLSLHTDGNPGSQLTLTRINYAGVAPVTLSIARSGTNVVLSWPNGTLQESTNVSGTYSNVFGATSPYTNPATAPRQFFRVKVQ